jgi:hypothetical protein
MEYLEMKSIMEWASLIDKIRKSYNKENEGQKSLSGNRN